MANTVMSLTRAGLSLYGKIQRGETKFEITRIVVGSTSLTNGESIETLTAIKNPVDVAVTVTANTIIGDGQTALYISIGHAKKDYELHQIGIMANDPDDGEILYSACDFGDRADYIDAYNGNYTVPQEGIIYTAIGNAAEIIINTTEGEAKLTRTEFVGHTRNKENPHEVTAEQLELGNVTNESKETMFEDPVFTGTPKAPTADKGTNSTQIATTAFVQDAISANNSYNSKPVQIGTWIDSTPIWRVAIDGMELTSADFARGYCDLTADKLGISSIDKVQVIVNRCFGAYRSDNDSRVLSSLQFGISVSSDTGAGAVIPQSPYRLSLMGLPEEYSIIKGYIEYAADQEYIKDEIVIETSAYTGDETKMHVEMTDGKLYTASNSTVTKDGEETVVIFT